MKMNKIAIVAAGLVLSTAALADNTIKFQGEVADQTCDISINGNASTPLILLPTVAASSLATAGATTGQTPFTISLTGCTPSVGTTAIKTVFVGNNLTATGNMGNTGTAKNVSLQLVDPASAATPLDLTGQNGAAGLSLANGATSASYDFAVRYFAEDTVEAGSVLGSVQYAVSYQ
ncbi:fimbrial protein [Serratia oryzae]|uniref:Fimbrial protein n=1 Tax=Serratia oryzae TaxID=2034155 RepID=A0A1S8CJL7_9GAMM|nr:fimbrial protein [Serratia oryzae]VXC67917.1 Fimbrial protein [Enterobacterales bacterium 8AC]